MREGFAPGTKREGPSAGLTGRLRLDCGNDLGGRRGEQGSHCRLGYSMRLVLSDLDVVAGRLDIPVAQQLAQLKHVDTGNMVVPSEGMLGLVGRPAGRLDTGLHAGILSLANCYAGRFHPFSPCECELSLTFGMQDHTW
jgi:hypothetical protein